MTISKVGGDKTRRLESFLVEKGSGDGERDFDVEVVGGRSWGENFKAIEIKQVGARTEFTEEELRKRESE